MQKLNIAYFGSPQLSTNLLEKLFDSDLPVQIQLIVSQPDRKIGKKQIITSTPIKQFALQQNIPYYDGNAKSTELVTQMKQKNIDLAILFAYGAIISSQLLNTPQYGFWNIHPSLLPLYRGSSPTVYPLLLGDTQTGVTLMQMDEWLDHGPIIAQDKWNITMSHTRIDHEILAVQSAYNLLCSYLIRLSQQLTIIRTEQNHQLATTTRLIKKDDGYIPLPVLKAVLEGRENNFIPDICAEFYQKNSVERKKLGGAKQIYNLHRALIQWPGLWTTIGIQNQQKRLKITDVSFNSGRLSINKVQLEGKKEVDIKTFSSSYPIFHP